MKNCDMNNGDLTMKNCDMNNGDLMGFNYEQW